MADPGVARLRIVALMSGTSCDGIDVALCEVQVGPHTLHVALQHFRTLAWPEHTRSALLALVQNPMTEMVPLASIADLNFEAGRALGEAVRRFLADVGVRPDEVDCIASHGHTVLHHPPMSTMQIGEPAAVAAATGITTIGDFRVADVAVGGQGAPLTSTFDALCLVPAASPTGGVVWRAVQNIGGIGNVTLVPSVASSEHPIAFDTGPGNVFIDMAASKVDASLRYDPDGRIAASGKVSEPLLAAMLQHPYFHRAIPKTTGREDFSRALFEEWWARGCAMGLTPQDLTSTFTELTAASIAQAIAASGVGALQDMVVGGGGARNPTLMSRLRHWLHRELGHAVAVTTHEELGINSDAKEAMAFAALGALLLAGRPGNVPSCTGATSHAMLGKVVPHAAGYGALVRKLAAVGLPV